jgi:sarcosine oxidase
VTATADVAVVGLGAAGSAILQALARRRVSAVGIDRFHPPHIHGSTHGRSRVIREAYYESPAYVPLVQGAYREWARIAGETGRPLFTRTGGLMIGPEDGGLVAGARRSATEHALPHELLSALEIRRRFPAFAPDRDQVGLLEPRAGFLDPEQCVSACLELAHRHGATLRLGTMVRSWRRNGSGIRLETSGGALDCGRVVFAAGPWLPSLLEGGLLPLTVERQLMYWFDPLTDPEQFRADRCPIFIWEYARDRFFYGIPDHGHGFKTALHHEGEVVTPDSVDREVKASEVALMRALLQRTIPGAPGALREAAVCLYTNTPDYHFVLGSHPGEAGIILASPCSGHGFKFASAVGEVVADLVVAGRTGYDLGPFSPSRFGKGAGGIRDP